MVRATGFDLVGESEVFEASVDRIDRSVAGMGPLEVGDYVDGSAFQGAAEPTNLERDGGDLRSERVHDSFHDHLTDRSARAQ